MKKKTLFKKFLIFQEIELSSSELKSLIFQKGSSKGMRIKKKKKKKKKKKYALEKFLIFYYEKSMRNVSYAF